jgi:hypothetical protein
MRLNDDCALPAPLSYRRDAGSLCNRWGSGARLGCFRSGISRLGEEYIDVVGESDLVDCFFLKVVEDGLIG